jgi:hypothetical protein
LVEVTQIAALKVTITDSRPTKICAANAKKCEAAIPSRSAMLCASEIDERHRSTIA